MATIAMAASEPAVARAVAIGTLETIYMWPPVVRPRGIGYLGIGWHCARVALGLNLLQDNIALNLPLTSPHRPTSRL